MVPTKDRKQQSDVKVDHVIGLTHLLFSILFHSVQIEQKWNGNGTGIEQKWKRNPLEIEDKQWKLS